MIIFRLLLLLIGAMALLGFYVSNQTDGFFVSEIPKAAPYRAGGEIARPSKEILDPIFSQPFTYLGKGKQCFAFESADHRIVIKFPYQLRAMPPAWLKLVPFVSDWYTLSKITRKAHKPRPDIDSYAIAFHELKEETGLIYFHMNRTRDLKRTLCVEDKLGFTHHIDLDTTEFILQKKADPIYETLAKWVQSNKLDDAKRGITRLVELFKTRSAKGIADPETHFEGNYGFVGSEPIQIDIGRLTKGPTEKAALWAFLQPLKAQLSEEFPTLASHLEHEFNHRE